MDEMRKKFPSLPSNYVTLLQLEQRKLDEQKMMKEDEEEQRKLEDQRLKDEQKRKEEEERKLRESVKRTEIKCRSSDLRYRRNSRMFLGKNRRTGEEIGSEMKNQETEAAVIVEGHVSDQDQKVEVTDKKKRFRKKKKKNKSKPKPDETPVEKSSPGGGKAKTDSGEGAVNQPENRKVLVQIASVEQSVEVAGKIEKLTVDGDGRRVKAHGDRSTGKINGNRPKYGNSTWFAYRNRWQRKDAGDLVWVKKEDISDGSPAGSVSLRRRD